jgi:hypothetical protein
VCLQISFDSPPTRIQDSVGIATSYRLDSLGFESWRSKRFPLLQNQVWGQRTLLFSGYQGCFLGVKWLGLEVDHSPPSNADIKNEWSYTCTHPVFFHGVDRNNFTVLPSPALQPKEVHELCSSHINFFVYWTCFFILKVKW